MSDRCELCKHGYWELNKPFPRRFACYAGFYPRIYKHPDPDIGIEVKRKCDSFVPQAELTNGNNQQNDLIINQKETQ